MRKNKQRKVNSISVQNQNTNINSVTVDDLLSYFDNDNNVQTSNNFVDKFIKVNDDNESLAEEESEVSDDELDLDDIRPKVHFQLISRTTISIEFQPLNSSTMEIESLLVKNGAYFQKDLQIWLVPFKEYPSLFSKFQKYKRTYNIKKIPQIALRAYNESSYTEIKFESKGKDVTIDYSSDDDNKKSFESLPASFKKKVYPFQKEGIEFALGKHCRILIADEMGVGKTIQAIGLCKLYQENWPVLIICPGSVKYSWKGELMNWLKIKEKYIQILNSSKNKFNNRAEFFIISYDLVRRVYKKLYRRKFEFIILDESHCIKNREALRTFYITPMAQKAKRLLLLSGTPLLSRPVEGYTALSCLRPDIFTSFMPYGKRYCDPKLTQFGLNWSGASNTKELHFILSTLMIRRLKKEVLNQLPPKRRVKIEIECEKKPLNQIKEYYANRGKKQNHPALSMPDIYRLTGEAKIKGIKAYVRDLLESEVKFLIFAHHKIVLNQIEKLVRKNKVGYIRIDGSTVGEERFDLVNKFQTNPNCLVAILSINAASTGITLTAASLVVFAELTWTPSIMIQAEDRAHRIGQESDHVDISYLYGRDTLDEYIFSKLSHKLNIVSTTLDDRKADLGLKENKKKESEDSEESSSKEEESSKKSLKVIKESDFDDDNSTGIDVYDMNIHDEGMKEKRYMDSVYEDNEEFNKTLEEKLTLKI